MLFQLETYESEGSTRGNLYFHPTKTNEKDFEDDLKFLMVKYIDEFIAYCKEEANHFKDKFNLDSWLHFADSKLEELGYIKQEIVLAGYAAGWYNRIGGDNDGEDIKLKELVGEESFNKVLQEEIKNDEEINRRISEYQKRNNLIASQE
jgi:hypothetical protein